VWCDRDRDECICLDDVAEAVPGHVTKVMEKALASGSR
jgi:hypothetical protein